MVAAAFAASKLISPNNPNPEKLTSYECGEEAIGTARIPFNSRFYVIALIFLLFDVEMMFIFPWATVFADKTIAAVDNRWTMINITEMFVFMGFLILGLAYVWVKGDLEWIKVKPVMPKVDVNIPSSIYETLNNQQAAFSVQPFMLHTETVTRAVPTPDNINAPVRKPMFKPAFKKTAE